jgi:hypothetical protein
MKDFNFKLLGTFDSSKILKKVESLSQDDWLEYTFRQVLFNKFHGQTLTIPLLYDEQYLSNMGKKSKFYKMFEEDIIELNKTYKSIMNKNGNIIRIEIVKMPPHTEIKRHFDATESFEYDNRTHLPIKTNEKVIFYVGGEEKNMKLNEIWEINNALKKHGVVNDSNYDRIHIIIDWKFSPNKLL